MEGLTIEAETLRAKEAVARRFHERQLKEPIEDIAALIHEDAEMRLVVSDLAPLRGHTQILSRLTEAREQMVYSATVDRCEFLDQDTLMLCGRARYALNDGLGHSAVFWIDQFRDGRLWRVHAFWSDREARDAYQELGTTLTPVSGGGSNGRKGSRAKRRVAS